MSQLAIRDAADAVGKLGPEFVHATYGKAAIATATIGSATRSMEFRSPAA